MVEIALSLAIIGFALVAIIGVLPTGLRVQQENHEETVIHQDGAYFLEAIRGGSHGTDDLVNHVEAITIRYAPYGSSSFRTVIYTNSASPAPHLPLFSGEQIIGLLSTPRIELLPDGTLRENLVEAQVKAISGRAGFNTVENDDLAFRYRLRSEIVPFTNRPPELDFSAAAGDPIAGTNFTRVLSRNLYEVRLTLAWPYFQRGGRWEVGRQRKVLRTMVGSELVFTNRFGAPLFYFEPNTFKALY
jgi:hypothetical protein